jgi:hypothetical protein
MNINKQSNIVADLQIGPTSIGMVRLFFSSDQVEFPMDFDPNEADDIADEIRLAAKKARKIYQK